MADSTSSHVHMLGAVLASIIGVILAGHRRIAWQAQVSSSDMTLLACGLSLCLFLAAAALCHAECFTSKEEEPLLLLPMAPAAAAAAPEQVLIHSPRSIAEQPEDPDDIWDQDWSLLGRGASADTVASSNDLVDEGGGSSEPEAKVDVWSLDWRCLGDHRRCVLTDSCT